MSITGADTDSGTGTGTGTEPETDLLAGLAPDAAEQIARWSCSAPESIPPVPGPGDGYGGNRLASRYLDAVTALEAAAAAALEADASTVTAAQSVIVAQHLEVLSRQVGLLGIRIAAVVGHSGASDELGYPNLAAFLRDKLHVLGPDAAARVRAARTRTPRPQPNGTIAAPLYPLLAAAHANGIVSDRHAQSIERSCGESPRSGWKRRSWSWCKHS